MSRNTYNKVSVNQILLFIIWPLLALVNSIRRKESAWAKNMFWFFCIYFGYTYVISSQGIDAYRYVESFKSLSNTSYTFKEFVAFLYSSETRYVDVLNPVLTYGLSRFTSNGHILLATYGMIFGFFYSRNLWYLFERINLRSSKITILFIIVFSLLNPIWKLGAFRFSTAIHVFLYGALPYLIEGDRKKLWACLFSVFVHFTFIFPVLVLILYIISGNRQSLFFFLFIISFFITELNIDFIRNQFANLPAVFQDKADNYMTIESYKHQVAGISRTNWYIKNYTLILKYLSTVFIIAMYIKRKQLFNNKGVNSLWSFAVLFYTFSNIAFLLPQGVRFYGIANLFVFFLLSWVSSLEEVPVLFRRLSLISIPVLLLIIIVDIRKGFDFTGLMTIFGNPVLASFFESGNPLIDFIK